MQSIGGMLAAIDLYELAIVPALLTNAESWTDISQEALDALEELQNMFLRIILRVPMRTPKMAMRWDFGMLSMRFRIMIRKLTFVNSLHHQDDKSLAKQILQEQVRQGWPGLAKESAEICQFLEMEDITDGMVAKNLWKRKVKQKTREKCEEEMKMEMKEKTKQKKMAEEEFGMKDYIRRETVEDVRTIFRVRSGMVDVKMNFMNDPKYSSEIWRCDSCKTGAIESQSHVLHCQAYKKLREGKDLNNDKDVADYFRGVLLIRSKLDLLK